MFQKFGDIYWPLEYSKTQGSSEALDFVPSTLRGGGQVLERDQGQKPEANIFLHGEQFHEQIDRTDVIVLLLVHETVHHRWIQQSMHG